MALRSEEETCEHDADGAARVRPRTAELTFTVAVVTRDRIDHLDRLLESLRNQTRSPMEILVVNNGAADPPGDVLRDATTTPVRLIERDDRSDLPGGRNIAIDAADGDVICFLDDDTVAEPTWLEGIEAGYRGEPDTAAVGGPAIESDESLTPLREYRRDDENINELNRYGEESDHSRRWLPPAPVETDKLQGANMSFRTDVLEDIGGFDAGYKGYPLFEETDVFAELWKRDETVIYTPDAFVYHLRATDGGWPSGRDEEYWYWFARNSIRYRKQNFPETYRISLLRLLVYTEYHPPPIWRQLCRALAFGDRRYLSRFRGYVDGVLFE